MFCLKFAQTYNHVIYNKYHSEPVIEDYFRTKDTAFCVADGITRDLANNTAVPYPETLGELQFILSNYPNPSGAYESAKICCDNFINYITKMDLDKISESTLSTIVKKVNADIQKINNGRIINYLGEDFYACEAVGGIIINNKLYCFSLGDCHITLLDENMNKLFDTPSNTNFTDYMKSYFDKFEFDWNHPECRYMIRKFFRNNPTLKDNSKDITYGALSGELEAEYYINIFCIPLTNVKYICAYSDGCEPNFENTENIKKLIENPESIQNYGKEKTLLLYENI